MHCRSALVSALLVVAAIGAGCGSDETPSETPAGNPDASSAVSVDITVSDGEITPSGAEVAVALDEEIDLVVTADAPGEIHVHSDPEAEFAYEGTGEPETFTLSIDRPGQVEVESHTLDKLIVKLVVS